MAKAEAIEIFNCSVEQFFQIISDYESYPKFLSEVKSCRILQQEESRKLVEYGISIIKNFTYNLWMTEEENKRIEWEFAGGDLFKVSTGSWNIEDEAGKTRAIYKVETQFRTFVPGPVAKALVQVNLPNMMSAYHKRVSELYEG